MKAMKIKVFTNHLFILEEIGQAHQLIEAGHAQGRIATKIL